MRSLLVAAVVLASVASARAADRVELLWPGGAPGAVGTEDQDRPTLTVRLASSGAATRTGVVVCPGGGYGGLALDHEGRQIADWLNGLGVSAFILKYRLAPRYRHPAPLADASRALRWVRSHAAELGIGVDRIGIWGFSAGGHLASSLGTHFDGGDAAASDPVERVSSRPDFMVLAYPVITFAAEYAHRGSRRNLLGDEPDPRLVEDLSNERRVTARTPPAFLFHTDSDNGVPPENSVAFYLALRKAGVAAELHVYERGKHGVGLAPSDPILATWPARLADWLKLHGFLTAP